MTRCELYYAYVGDFRRELRAIWAEYESRMQALEKFKGSSGFEIERREAEEKRDLEIKNLQESYRKTFGGLIQRMRESAQNVSMLPPSQEQLAILSALKMRSKLSRDEIEQAARSLRGCPVALSVLDELAEANEIHGGYSAMSTKAILGCIDSLAQSANRLCKLDKPDSRAEMIERASPYSPNYQGLGVDSLYSFRVDYDPPTLQNCLTNFGDVPAGSLEEFQNAVDN